MTLFDDFPGTRCPNAAVFRANAAVFSEYGGNFMGNCGNFSPRDGVPSRNGGVLPIIGTANAAAQENVAVSRETLPRNDSDFAQFLAVFAETAAAHAAELPLSAEDLAEIAGFHQTVAQDLQAVANQRAILRTAVAQKEQTLAAAEGFLRVLVRKIQADPDVSPGLVASMGIVTRRKGVARSVDIPDALEGHVEAGGVTVLTWNGGHNARGTLFCVQKKTSAAPEFVLVGVTSKTRFRDVGAVPGEKVLYRVYAQRADRKSLPSNAAWLYGA